MNMSKYEVSIKKHIILPLCPHHGQINKFFISSLGNLLRFCCPHRNHTKCIYNWYIQNVHKMYPPFQQTFVYILYNKLKELWQLNFVYILYTKVCRNTLDTFYIHFVYINSDLQKVYIDHKKTIQDVIQIIVWKMDPTFPLILTCLLYSC